MSKQKVKQERLFDLPILPPKYTPYEKAKWRKKFKEYCQELYNKESENTGVFTCGNMYICEMCECKKGIGIDDCFDIILKVLRKNIKEEIDYRRYDNFQEYIDEVEYFMKNFY